MQIFRLSITRVKINQMPYVIFEVTSQFSFKFFLWNFQADSYALNKKSPSKYIV